MDAASSVPVTACSNVRRLPSGRTMLTWLFRSATACSGSALVIAASWRKVMNGVAARPGRSRLRTMGSRTHPVNPSLGRAPASRGAGVAVAEGAKYHRMRGYFGIGAEGISKPTNVGNLARSAHAFGASFLFLVDPHHTIETAHADTSESERQVPLYRFDFGRGAAAAARLHPDRRRAARRGGRPAELSPSAERRLRVRPRARLAVARRWSSAAITW